MHAFSYTAVASLHCGGVANPRAASFFSWYSEDATQIGLSPAVNSLFMARRRFGQGDPGLPSATRRRCQTSDDESRRLLKRTPSGGRVAHVEIVFGGRGELRARRLVHQ